MVDQKSSVNSDDVLDVWKALGLSIFRSEIDPNWERSISALAPPFLPSISPSLLPALWTLLERSLLWQPSLLVFAQRTRRIWIVQLLQLLPSDGLLLVWTALRRCV